ncbi:DUF1295 domain-containing protein [Aeromicrobium sp. CF4.19]|uniref:DUF1295 domain-containing protein n=1 Tax=Aeromicrobium sp. CF4.19 TaxID=3373082 RepID=UPI003EE7CE2D
MIENDVSQSLVTLAIGFATIVLYLAACLAISVRQQKLTVVDTAWGLGFVLVGIVSVLVSDRGEGMPGPALLLIVLVGIWGVRLAFHLHTRNSGKDEDPRYQQLADADGRSFIRVALTRVFLPQGLAMFLVATPLMVGMNNAGLIGWLAWLGAAVWAVGFFFEAVGDWQLKQFKKNPDNKGEVMDQGLWRFTRHPNYFGDACVWTGIWLVAAASLPGLLTVISPIAMTFFLTKVTGASLNEKGMRETKPGYEDYVRRTSGFFPLPPKSRS